MAVAPLKVQSVSTNDRKVADFYFFRDCFRFQRALAGPLIHALRAGARAPESCGLEVTDTFIRPCNPQAGTPFLHDLARLNRQPSLNRCITHKNERSEVRGQRSGK